MRWPDRRMVGFGLGGVLGYWFYVSTLRPGGDAYTLVQDVMAMLGGRVSLTEKQQNAVAVITNVANDRGYGWLVPALIANAWRESALNPDAIGDGGHSVGLFQLHDRGAGAGMSTAERADPAKNTRRILDVVDGPDGDGVRAARAAGATNAELAAAFAHHIEKCAACGWSAGSAELDARRAAVESLFGPNIAAERP